MCKHKLWTNSVWRGEVIPFIPISHRAYVRWCKSIETSCSCALVFFLSVCARLCVFHEQVTGISSASCPFYMPHFFGVLFLVFAFYCNRFDMNTLTKYYLVLYLCDKLSRKSFFFLVTFSFSYSMSFTMFVGFALLATKRN